MDEGVEEYVCPACGSLIDRDATECPICGEAFADGVGPKPVSKAEPDAALEGEDAGTEPGMTPDGESPPVEPGSETPAGPDEELEVPTVCELCGKELPEGADKCPDCAVAGEEEAKEERPVASSCPACGSKKYTAETGDLVKCEECGNTYVRSEPEGFFKSWKWKFWVGLTFILVGDFGFALASYLHNVVKWTFLGDMYLGYGWLDSSLGVVGIVLFAVGILLFVWSFKREREVKCQSCGEYLLESELIPTEEPTAAPTEEAVQEVLGEIEELNCPNCGVEITMFDEKCPSCGHVFTPAAEPGEETFETVEPGEVPAQAEGTGQEELILESIETLSANGTPGPDRVSGVAVEKYIMDDLEKLESTSDVKGKECPECGIVVEKGSTECPVCGAKFEGGE
jgi:RNA polymerase subunit RPABC4/transcription elongation factor Spt4